MKITTTLFLLLIFTSLSTLAQEHTATFLWETDTLLDRVESVIYDPVSNFIYTTNIDGEYMEKDGVGSISKIDMDGNIVARDWIDGLNGPSGTGIYDGKLYVGDMDRILEIDIASAKILNAYDLPEAKRLNDLDVAEDGTVYVSDTGGNQLFKLKNGKTTKIAEDLESPNGVLSHNGKILVTNWNQKSLNFYDVQTGQSQQIIDGIDGPDGIEAINDNNYLVSGYEGIIYIVNTDGSKTVLLDTSKEGIIAADIGYDADSGLLMIPTMTRKTIRAYQVSNE